jgi:hypothetical protein
MMPANICKNCDREFTEVVVFGADGPPISATADDAFCSGLCQLDWDAREANMSIEEYLNPPPPPPLNEREEEALRWAHKQSALMQFGRSMGWSRGRR